MRIISQAPTRISLIGGGTDVDPFAFEHGGIVLSLAIDLCHIAELRPDKSKKIKVRCLGEEREFDLRETFNYSSDKKFNLVRSVINYFHSQIPTGFNLRIFFKEVGSSGLGSSASATTSMIGAFTKWLNIDYSRLETALLAFRLENEELGWHTGKQDQLAAAFGGINIFYFGPGNKVSIESLDLEKSKIQELKEWLVMYFTGKTRKSSNLTKVLKKKMAHYTGERELFALKDSVYEGVKLIKTGNFTKLGRVLDEVWENKKRSNPQATNERIDNLYSLALKNGALGGKIMGAGGEGHMFFFCPPEKQKNLVKVLKKEKVKVIDFNFDFEGLRIKVEK